MESEDALQGSTERTGNSMDGHFVRMDLPPSQNQTQEIKGLISLRRPSVRGVGARLAFLISISVDASRVGCRREKPARIGLPAFVSHRPTLRISQNSHHRGPRIPSDPMGWNISRGSLGSPVLSGTVPRSCQASTIGFGRLLRCDRRWIGIPGPFCVGKRFSGLGDESAAAIQ